MQLFRRFASVVSELRERLKRRIALPPQGISTPSHAPTQADTTGHPAEIPQPGSRPLQTILRAEDLELDCVLRTVRRGGKKIELTPRQFSLLEYFMRNAGRPLTYNMIIENVWRVLPPSTNVVDVSVYYLRRKIDSNHNVKLIRRVQSGGYEFGPETSNTIEAK